jgi:hypothetical protein
MNSFDKYIRLDETFTFGVGGGTQIKKVNTPKSASRLLRVEVYQSNNAAHTVVKTKDTNKLLSVDFPRNYVSSPLNFPISFNVFDLEVTTNAQTVVTVVCTFGMPESAVY